VLLVACCLLSLLAAGRSPIAQPQELPPPLAKLLLEEHARRSQ
jgi:hypothetical protein